MKPAGPFRPERVIAVPPAPTCPRCGHQLCPCCGEWCDHMDCIDGEEETECSAGQCAVPAEVCKAWKDKVDAHLEGMPALCCVVVAQGPVEPFLREIFYSSMVTP